jgi:hypothetical protein
MYIGSYLCIIAASVALRWHESNPYGSSVIRTSLLVLNLVILLLSLCTFEIKSLLNDGLDYFSSFFNKNDMMLFALSVVCLAQEIVCMIKSKDQPNPLPKDAVLIFNKDQYYKYPGGKSTSIKRVFYSLLIVVVHIKILNVLSFYSSIAFLVKMMEKIINEIGSFALFFCSVLFCFCLCN